MQDARLDKREWFVAPVDIETARRLVETYHYARGASNTATHLDGLFRRGSPECMGVAWWLPPTRAAAMAINPQGWTRVLSLSRLVIVPGVPANACSFLLSRSVRSINYLVWSCLVTYADTWRGHRGTIYRASGWEYRGLTKPQRVYVRDGVMISRKAGARTRTHAQLLALGAVCMGYHAKHRFVKFIP